MYLCACVQEWEIKKVSVESRHNCGFDILDMREEASDRSFLIRFIEYGEIL